MIKIPREESEFVTPEGRFAFLFAYPGEHQESFGNRAYKVEWSGDIPPDHKMVKAARRVASAFDSVNPEKHIFGLRGRLQKIEEKTGRDISKYGYAAGKYVIDFSKVLSLKSLKMGELDLSVPANRQAYDAALNEAAPCVHRFANIGDPADIVRIQQLNQERLLQGLPAHPEDKWSKVLLRVHPNEVWAGCYGHVSGYFYWNQNGKPPSLGIGLNHILMTRTGERLTGAPPAPDTVFSEFAPSSELAPPPPRRDEVDMFAALR